MLINLITDSPKSFQFVNIRIGQINTREDHEAVRIIKIYGGKI